MAANHPDHLDVLLDSALYDFQNVNLTYSAQRSENNEVEKGECSMSMPTSLKGLGMGLPDLRSKKKGKQKVVKKELHVFEALVKLGDQTKEAVKGSESVTGVKPCCLCDGIGNDATMEELVKQFEELPGFQIETMRKQLISKEILHKPMKDTGERYLKWLEEHEANLSSEDYERYSCQNKIIQELNVVYETDPNNFTKIFNLLQKMQECGQSPDGIVIELAPDFDFATLGQLSPEMH